MTVTAIAVMAMIRSAGDTVTMWRMGAVTGITIVRPTATGRGRLVRPSGLTAVTGVNGIANRAVTVERTDTAEVIEITETTMIGLVEMIASAMTNAVTTARAEIPLPIAVETGTATDCPVAPLPDDALRLPDQRTTVMTAHPVTRTPAASGNAEITTTETGARPLLVLQQASLTRRHWRKSDAAN